MNPGFPAVFQNDLLRGRVALITGGGTGICRGIALAFAAHGADVAITSRKPDHLEPTAREIEACGVRALALPADVRDPSAVAEAVASVERTFGRLDLVVNGAAGNFVCAAEDLSPNGFGTVVDIDLKGTFHACKAALPLLSKAGGAVINISATLHYGGTPLQLHAASAKAGIDALTRTLAVEWGPAKIRVNGVAPGPVEGTEGLARLLPADLRARAERAIPLRRFGTTQEIADAVLFLASPASAYTTGAVLVVDGGQWLLGNNFLALAE